MLILQVLSRLKKSILMIIAVPRCINNSSSTSCLLIYLHSIGKWKYYYILITNRIYVQFYFILSLLLTHFFILFNALYVLEFLCLFSRQFSFSSFDFMKYDFFYCFDFFHYFDYFFLFTFFSLLCLFVMQFCTECFCFF